jgi:hypothetical protein
MSKLGARSSGPVSAQVLMRSTGVAAEINAGIFKALANFQSMIS